jgi:hypothetical protein
MYKQKTPVYKTIGTYVQIKDTCLQNNRDICTNKRNIKRTKPYIQNACHPS